MTEGKSHQTSQFYCALIMATVLGLSLAWAWMICKSRTGQADQARRIVAEMREAGLDRLIGQGGREQWYIQRYNGENIGWSYTGITANGKEVEGTTVFYTKAPKRTICGWEKWELDNKAQNGDYVAGTFEGEKIRPDTGIRLIGRKISVYQNIDNSEYKTAAIAMPEYLPEGTMELAAAQVGKLRTTATFRCIINDVAPEDGRPTFAFVRMEYAGQNSDFGGPDVTLEYAVSGRSSSSKTYKFDSSGKIAAVQNEFYSEQLADKAKVLAEFPDAKNIIQKISASINDSADKTE